MARTYIDVGGITRIIMVIRIWCDTNYRNRAAARKQYTLTILPAFLIPCSRMLLPAVYASITAYIYGRCRNQYEATFAMGARNRGTFLRYYYRYVSRVPEWTVFLFSQAVLIGGAVCRATINDTSAYSNTPRLAHERLRAAAREYFAQYARLPGSGVILEEHYFQAVHCKLCVHKSGLGP